MTFTLSVIITTIGRASLVATLDSLKAQEWRQGDEVILVSDGPASEFTRRAWAASGLQGRLVELEDGPHYDWAAAARTRGRDVAKGLYVLHMDDDDCYMPDALAKVRKATEEHPGAMLLFQARFMNGSVIWRHKFLIHGMAATAQFVYPRDAVPGEWGTRYEGDFDFIRQTVERNHRRPLVWVPEVVVLFRHEPKPIIPREPINALWVGRLSVIERLSLASYVRNGHPVRLHAYEDVGDVPAGTTVVDATTVLPRESIFRYTLEHFERPNYSAFSDCFRFKLLSEQGGWWSDLDVICLRSYDFDMPFVLPSEVDHDRVKPASCVIRAPAGDAMADAWRRCQPVMGQTRGGLVGPRILAETIAAFRLEEFLRPCETFCPVPFMDWGRYIASGEEQCRLLHDIGHSHACHLWNEMWTQGGIDKDADFPMTSQVEIWKRHYLSRPVM